MIPEEKKEAVVRGLRETFGVMEWEDLQPLSGGMSTALVFRMKVSGAPYFLRVIMRRDAIGDPTRQFACMRAGAEAGIAPRILYGSVEDRVLISDFVEAKPLPTDMAVRIARTIRTLHSLPRFEKTVDYFAMIQMFMKRVEAARLLQEEETEELFRRYAEIVDAYPRNEADLVVSHNDLKPQNTLFDGERIQLVDWEAAFLNDRYVDLAIVANFYAHDDAEEAAFLAEYFGESANEEQRHCFYLMQQVVHMAYAMCFMALAAGAGATLNEDLSAPDFREFHEGLIRGTLDLMEADARMLYGRVHLERLRRNMRTKEFELAIGEGRQS